MYIYIYIYIYIWMWPNSTSTICRQKPTTVELWYGYKHYLSYIYIWMWSTKPPRPADRDHQLYTCGVDIME